MKVILYNILDGGMDRVPKLLAWLEGQSPDVVALCELNGWRTERLRAAGAAMGLPHAAVLEGVSAYRVGLMSRQPVEVRGEFVAGLHHGALHVATFDMELVVTHFSPSDADLRLREAEQVAAVAAGAVCPALLLGDLNSHSRTDRELCEAFATPENHAWAFDFAVHDTLTAAGLTDLAAMHMPRHTTATLMKPDEPRRRLDFIYANAAFRQRHPRLVSTVSYDPAIAVLSDHWPVVLEAPHR